MELPKASPPRPGHGSGHGTQLDKLLWGVGRVWRIGMGPGGILLSCPLGCVRASEPPRGFEARHNYAMYESLI